MIAYFEKVVPEDNCFRFYEITTSRDLFAEASLSIRWGRIGKPGQMRIRGSGSQPEMMDLMKLISSQRIRRGYKADGIKKD